MDDEEDIDSLDALILTIAQRLEWQSRRLQKAAIIDDHQKAGTAQYLLNEAASLRVIVQRRNQCHLRPKP